MQINRDLYLNKLVHAIGNQMIKVVTGMQVREIVSVVHYFP